jgi:hypothetical protein
MPLTVSSGTLQVPVRQKTQACTWTGDTEWYTPALLLEAAVSTTCAGNGDLLATGALAHSPPVLHLWAEMKASAGQGGCRSRTGSSTAVAGTAGRSTGRRRHGWRQCRLAVPDMGGGWGRRRPVR